MWFCAVLISSSIIFTPHSISSPPSPSARASQKDLGLAVGDYVEVRDLPSSPWLPGVVVKVVDDGRARVRRDQDRLSKKGAFFFREVRRAVSRNKDIQRIRAELDAMPWEDRAMSPLVNELGKLLHKSGDVRGAKTVLEEALVARRDNLGDAQ